MITTERPILFSGPMVKAILEGRKTQTRRVVTPSLWPLVEASERHNGYVAIHMMDFDLPCPYGIPGDKLWLRETFGIGSENNLNHPSDEQIFYRATDPEWDTEKTGFRWRPSIHMPRWASRITLEVTNVRVQRLQEITNDDAIAEGMVDSESPVDFARYNFQLLWDSINAKRNNGAYAWAKNPWVWVVSFRKI